MLEQLPRVTPEPHKLNTLLKIIKMMINLLVSGFTSDLKKSYEILMESTSLG